MTPIEKFLCIISNDTVVPANVIVILEGDGFNRIQEGARLFREGFIIGHSPVVLISGGVDNPPSSYTASDMKPKLVEAGVPEKYIMLEEGSKNTRDQAVEVMTLARKYNWWKMIIVASHYHQYRAYLTFLKAMRELELELIIMNSPARNLPWFAEDAQGRRIDLLQGEFDRIERYTPMGHLTTFEEAIEYQKWKEKKLSKM